MKAPFPYFGGKSLIAHIVWRALGDTPNYIEPFFGSGAMLLARPDRHRWWERIETANDLDGLLANFWRAVQTAPDEVARWADGPINENDLHSRHAWLVGQRDSLQARLEGAPDYYDAKIAGWWVWGMCAWIGGGWCGGEGPWHVADGELVKDQNDTHAGTGIKRQLPHLGTAGRGINRQLPHLSDAGKGHCEAWSEHLRAIMQALQDRLRRVRVCCGDWARICGPSLTTIHGLTGVFLDPPYNHAERDSGLYRVEMGTADEVRQWAVDHGSEPSLRIALCGYADEHTLPSGWTAFRWKANGGYGTRSAGRGLDNRTRECVWFSPHCLPLSAARQQILEV